ncbi:M23 family metallopeptidase [uncultured Algibacter sp.]|uniref:M23 family metallopeptidase n=1 Tax=uncultured Algibacter sp. TaxID=298659 RepID=UPI002614F873|nr:M23 family metallopeptidase [uncultured Algibacter sp.]
MRKLVVLIFILCLQQTSNCQDYLAIKQGLDSIAKRYAINVTNAPKIKAPQVNIKSNYWDTINFNPYRNQLKKFPFQIKFTDSIYTSPVMGKKVITSRYGWRRGRPHKGIDIDLVTGDSLVAMFDGIVRFARYSSGHGRTVVVRHFNGLETVYAHLSSYAVKANDTVKSGQLLGKGGTSGNARGSHLHLVVSYKGNYINPEYLFDFSENNKVRDQNIWVTKKWVKSHFHTSKRQSELELFTTEELAIAAQKKENRKKVYIVKSGDTLSGISSKYHVSLSRLCKANAISKTSTLRIGQKLIINR